MTLALARLPLARLRAPRGWLPAILWSLLAIGAALSSRTAGLGSGADHVLRGTFALAVLPLITYGLVSATLGGGGLRSSTRGLVALGGVPARAALATVLVAMATSALVCGVIAMAVCALAHGGSDAPLVSDLPASFGVAFLGGATYAAYFCAGSAIGRGVMRGAFLVIDYLVGMPAGFGSVFTPRAHVMSLLGGPASFDLSRRVSSIILLALMLVYLAFAVLLSRRVRR